MLPVNILQSCVTDDCIDWLKILLVNLLNDKNPFRFHENDDTVQTGVTYNMLYSETSWYSKIWTKCIYIIIKIGAYIFIKHIIYLCQLSSMGQTNSGDQTFLGTATIKAVIQLIGLAKLITH